MGFVIIDKKYELLHELIKDQMPPIRKGLWGAYKEIIPALYKQSKNPDYKIDLLVPSKI